MPIQPSMHQLSAVRRREEQLEGFHFNGTRPVARLYLDKHDIHRANADDVKHSERSNGARAGVTSRFKQPDAAAFVASAFGLPVHGCTSG
jgi:hypothetical protein